MIINPYSFGQSKRLLYLGQQTGATGSGNYSVTIPDVNFGPSGSKRVEAMVAWSAAYSSNMSSFTIAGGAATRRRRVNTSNATINLESWFIATSSDSGSLTLAFSQHTVSVRVSLWWADPTYVGSNDSASLGSATSRSGTLTTYDDGYLFAGACWTPNSRTASWSNATELYESGFESFAMDDETTAGSVTVTATLNSSSANFHFLAVSAR